MPQKFYRHLCILMRGLVAGFDFPFQFFESVGFLLLTILPIGELLVVEREDEKELVGFIPRSDIIKAHRKKMEEEGLAAPSKGS